MGISSLRADRLDDEFVGLLAEGGYRSMTIALDAASACLRYEIEKNQTLIEETRAKLETFESKGAGLDDVLDKATKKLSRLTD